MMITTQKQIRSDFWARFPDLPRRRIKDHLGIGLMYPVEVQTLFAQWVDYLERDGQITEALAFRATLDGDAP
jgi:hypothetical protein